MAAMGLIVFMLILGLAYQTFLQRDLGFQRQQLLQNRAQALARSGMEHYLYQMRQVPVVMDAYNPVQIDIGSPPTEQILINVENVQRTTTITGRILNTDGDVLAERRIVIPRGDMERAYDVSL